MLIEGMVSIEELALVQKKGIESSHEEQNSLNSRRHTCTITAAAGRRRGGGGVGLLGGEGEENTDKLFTLRGPIVRGDLTKTTCKKEEDLH